MPIVSADPLRSGWIYPCSVEEVEGMLALLPAEDLADLHQVKLTAATRYDETVYGRYVCEGRAGIHLYAQPRERSFRTHFGRRHVRCCLADEVRFGLQYEDPGPTLICTWQPAALRRWVLEFVLLHEVGHHVCHLRRIRRNRAACPGLRECERFADAYARAYVIPEEAYL